MTVYTGSSSTGRKFVPAKMCFSPGRLKFELAENLSTYSMLCWTQGSLVIGYTYSNRFPLSCLWHEQAQPVGLELRQCACVCGGGGGGGGIGPVVFCFAFTCCFSSPLFVHSERVKALSSLRYLDWQTAPLSAVLMPFRADVNARLSSLLQDSDVCTNVAWCLQPVPFLMDFYRDQHTCIHAWIDRAFVFGLL